MKYFRGLIRLKLIALLLLLAGAPLAAYADSGMDDFVQPGVLIVELMPDRTPSAKSDEFIELYNASDRVIPGATLEVQTFATTASSWSASPAHKVVLTQDFYPGRHYLLASSSYTDLADSAIDIFPGSSLSATAGHVRIVDIATNQAGDYVEWGDSAKYTTLQSGNTLHSSLTYPDGASQSFKRKVTEDGGFIDTGKNADDFIVSSSPSPQADNVLPDGYVVSNQAEGQTGDGSVTPTAGIDSEGTPGPTPPSLANAGLAAPQITELLPNPAAPQTDENDEFIELYNPNDKTFDLKGYTLESGTGTLHDYTFANDTMIPPTAYVVFYASQTRLPLGNSGSQVRLLDAGHTVVNGTAAYGTAVDGQAWAFDDESNASWIWTTVPTPGAANVIAAPVLDTATKTTAVAKSTKTTKAKVSSKKAATTKAKKPKAIKTTKVKTTSAITPATSQTVAGVPIHSTVLVVVGVLAVLYGAYEYRHDVANRIHRFRANRAARAKARSQAEGR